MRSRLIRASPILPVRDLRAALAHYRTLGFRARAYDDGYGFVERGRVSLHLTARGDYSPNAETAVAYIECDDADALAAEWTQPGVGGVTNPPIDTPWRMREGTHVDPDGNLLRFGSPLPEPSLPPGGIEPPSTG